MLSKLTDSSTPAKKPNLFIETSFDQKEDVSQIWEECEKVIDELQKEKEKEIIELTERCIMKKLERIAEAKIERDFELKTCESEEVK